MLQLWFLNMMTFGNQDKKLFHLTIIFFSAGIDNNNSSIEG